MSKRNSANESNIEITKVDDRFELSACVNIPESIEIEESEEDDDDDEMNARLKQSQRVGEFIFLIFSLHICLYMIHNIKNNKFIKKIHCK